jgi:hypothetical protein
MSNESNYLGHDYEYIFSLNSIRESLYAPDKLFYNSA